MPEMVRSGGGHPGRQILARAGRDASLRSMPPLLVVKSDVYTSSEG
jgi:hypothetical protein